MTLAAHSWPMPCAQAWFSRFKNLCQLLANLFAFAKHPRIHIARITFSGINRLEHAFVKQVAPTTESIGRNDLESPEGLVRDW